MPERGALRSFGQGRQHLAHALGRAKLHVGRPGPRGVVEVDSPSPTTRCRRQRTKQFREPIDVRHNAFAIGRVGDHPLLNPHVLHVDHDQGRLGRIELLQRVRFAAASLWRYALTSHETSSILCIFAISTSSPLPYLLQRTTQQRWRLHRGICSWDGDSTALAAIAQANILSRQNETMR